MAGPVAQGGTITLDANYRNGGTGALVDPLNPGLELEQPDGVVFADVVPVRIAVGQFSYVFVVPVDAELGNWVARWTGTVNGAAVAAEEQFDVVLPGAIVPAGIPWGATVEGIRGLLPQRLINAVSTPNEGQVEGFLATTGNWVASRLGDLSVYTPSTVERITATAKGLTEMGAAALTENATFPERAGVAGSSYGDWLWVQYLRGIDELLESLQKPTEDTGGAGGETPTGDVPAFSTPDPMFYRDTGF